MHNSDNYPINNGKLVKSKVVCVHIVKILEVDEEVINHKGKHLVQVARTE